MSSFWQKRGDGLKRLSGLLQEQWAFFPEIVSLSTLRIPRGAHEGKIFKRGWRPSQIIQFTEPKREFCLVAEGQVESLLTPPRRCCQPLFHPGLSAGKNHFQWRSLGRFGLLRRAGGQKAPGEGDDLRGIRKSPGKRSSLVRLLPKLNYLRASLTLNNVPDPDPQDPVGIRARYLLTIPLVSAAQSHRSPACPLVPHLAFARCGLSIPVGDKGGEG
jgi:hypothetical protein